MRYLLDTNIVSDLIRQPQGRAATRIREVGEAQVRTSIIVAAPADAVYGTIRASLEQAGTPIGGNNLLIAAHALALGDTIVTDNVEEFGRVEGLNVENWLRG